MADNKIIAVMGATGSQGGGLVRAILDDEEGDFSARAITRDANSDDAKKLADRGAEVVEADLDDPESIKRAFEGAYGAYCVTFYWAHMDPDKETRHGQTLAEAAAHADLQHVIWSTLEDVRDWVPVNDDSMPTLMEKYKVPHFDAKADADHYFTENGVPTTFMMVSFYWDNMIYFGMGPQRGEDGTLAITFPMGDKKLAGIAAEDIGRCALGIFKSGDQYTGQRIGIAGDHLTCKEMARVLGDALGEDVRYNEVSAEAFRGFDFPGAADMGNMFQFYRDFEEDCLSARDLDESRSLNPDLQTFEDWVTKNKDRIPEG